MEKLIIRDNKEMLYPVVNTVFIDAEDTLDIWIKFLSYLKSEEEALLKEENYSSKVYNDIKKQLELLKLFLKYKNRECNLEEHNKVVDYMETTKLSFFIESRLNEEEKNEAIDFVSDLFENDELDDYIDNCNGFEDLNIKEAYTLYKAKEKQHDERQKVLKKEIHIEQLERVLRLNGSLFRDFGHKY